MKKEMYIITKNEYDGEKRVIGYFKRINNDLYYDVGSLNGSHNSYHRDGSEWRTSYDGKKRKIIESVPLSDFKGFHPLGIVMFTKELIPLFPKAKQKHINKALLEIDIDRFPSNTFNLVIEIIEPFKNLVINEDTQYPSDAIVSIRKEMDPWVIFTILGHDNNLLITPSSGGFTLNHFNKRYTANAKDKQYNYEAINKELYETS
ncbi:MAG: hypothetical protein PHQ93_07925 [Sulfurimonas sp.]|uniref:hypothetical protein n=1 Tax=Sulfurimonas sp. TaxID=2022749 RepID=UPI002627E8C0|nr:hypothetical protein [Sulfurimonas sp.]MDD5401097.1 hypothetical protein [Sulfurimonas sp.]